MDSQTCLKRLSCFASMVIWLLLILAEDTIAQEPRSYDKREVQITMRDGVRLHTTIYSPSDKSRRYPILLQRTPYGCNPYGAEKREPVMYNPFLVSHGYIFVYQDLRGRSMSEGDPKFENLKPVYSLDDTSATDEVTDTHDTIEWLLENVDNHNQAVGMFGSSYMGYTALMGAVSAHPNLKAVHSAAPSIDLFFEDFNRNGLYTLAYTPILDWFGTERTARSPGPWWKNNLDYWADRKRFGLAKDSYQFFLEKGSLKNFSGDLVPDSNYFWKAICEHPNYDEYRKRRDVRQYLRGIECPVLIVGGWNDEQNLFGAIEAFRTINRHNPDCDVRLVMGPWNHSGHKKKFDGYVGNVFFDKQLVEDYQRYVESKFFDAHLRGSTKLESPVFPKTALLYDTGTKEWKNWEDDDDLAWLTQKETMFSIEGWNLDPTGMALTNIEDEEKLDSNIFAEFISDPAKPVPYIEDDEFHLFPAAEFMTADQRSASKRPDVLTFVGSPLQEDLTITGPIEAKLLFSTTQTDADLIVKLIDVYPMNRRPDATDRPTVKMNGYQQLIRCGQIRGRFRESYEWPKPFEANEPTQVNVPLLDVNHTFKKGHRVMIQVQSSLFPLFDRNPQKYVENIYEAEDTDFTKATHRVYRGSQLYWKK